MSGVESISVKKKNVCFLIFVYSKVPAKAARQSLYDISNIAVKHMGEWTRGRLSTWACEQVGG